MDSSRSFTSFTWNSRKAGVSSVREIENPDLGLVRQGPLQT